MVNGMGDVTSSHRYPAEQMFGKQEDQALVPCPTDVHGGLTAADVSGWCPDTDASDTGPNSGLVTDQVIEVVKHWHDP